MQIMQIQPMSSLVTIIYFLNQKAILDMEIM